MQPVADDADKSAVFAAQLLAVLDLARSILYDLDIDLALERVTEAARELTGATYAALGVLDGSRAKLERFVTVGIDDQSRQAIGPLPLGRGVLGELIRKPEPLRLDDVGQHPHSYGFPAGHPPMTSFLGVPILIDQQPFGNLYLTNKRGGGSFSEEDERSLVLMAEFAGIAIDHARRYSTAEARRLELQSTVDALDATVQIAQAVGGETDLNVVLELVAKRGRALVSARALVIEQDQNGRTVVAAAAGAVPADLVGREVDSTDSVAGSALLSRKTLRLEEESNRRRFERHGLGRFGLTADCGLVVPLLFRGKGYGVLLAIDRVDGGATFKPEDQRLLEAFAASAATAIATAESARRERERQRLAAAEQERKRWARELHDETLQNLAAMRLALARQLRGDDAEAGRRVMLETIEQLDTEIGSLRSLIAELRPAALDDLGLAPAIEFLADRARGRGLDVDLDIELAHELGRPSDRLAPEIETAVYRIIQEALTNAHRHGQARHVSVSVHETEATIEVSVSDDGIGFDTPAKAAGFGLLGMQERADIVSGRLSIASTAGDGTVVSLAVPAVRVGDRVDQLDLPGEPVAPSGSS